MIAMAPPRSARPATAISQQAPSGGGQAPALDYRVPLVPDAQAASQARRLLRTVITTWGLRVDVDVAVLLASELVTNAVIHADGEAVPHAEGAITMRVRCARGELRVEVHDRSPSLPAPAAPEAGDDAESGRGLMLVVALAAEWGFDRTPGGKVVYFTLPFEAAPLP